MAALKVSPFKAISHIPFANVKLCTPAESDR
jgi:hypothetical protein